ncbi:hypothetical protein [Rhodococcus chondri]|uniref:Uncharacterized protein n=1 Tax=Rhodococcus chondri TaxID=3065941 RepID=A0ABU7JUD3_9NOCA|nr:hypothetical protein [Rhodococcus sp. CC-R104]MEE2033633.1 hypothetical protein [Rhodococcus sp. CC-R104]
MELTMSFPKKGTVGRPREERAVEGAVLAYRAVVECIAAGEVPNVKAISEHAGVSATDRDPRRRVYFFHLGRTLCVEAGLLTVAAHGRSHVYSVVGQSLTDAEVAAAVMKVITPEKVALQRKGRNTIKHNRLADSEFKWDRCCLGAVCASLLGEAAPPRGAL